MNIVLFCDLLLSAISILAAVLMIRAAKRSKALIDRNLNRTFHRAKKSAEKRKKQQEGLRIEDGNQEKNTFFYKMDLSLAQSGLSSRFPFLNTEIFLGIVTASVAVTFILGVRKNILMGMIAASLTVFLYYAVLFLLTARNYRRTEKQIISFVGMLKNYARTNDDLLSILKSVSVYLEEPLKSIVVECQAEAAATGNISAAMTRMALKVEHKEFKKIIGNLEICSRRKANYAVIIDRSMQQLRAYIAVQEENKKMVGNARKTILMIIAIGILSFTMLDDFAEGGVIHFLQQSFLGKCILFYLFFAVLYALWKIISMGRKD